MWAAGPRAVRQAIGKRGWIGTREARGVRKPGGAGKPDIIADRAGAARRRGDGTNSGGGRSECQPLGSGLPLATFTSATVSVGNAPVICYSSANRCEGQLAVSTNSHTRPGADGMISIWQTPYHYGVQRRHETEIFGSNYPAWDAPRIVIRLDHYQHLLRP